MATDWTMEPIATALKRLRDSRGMTDTDVWAAAGISSGALSRYMNGSRGIAIDWRGARTVRKLARVFDVDPEYFLEYRVWRLTQLARLDADAATAAYRAAMELSRLGGALVALEALERELDDEEQTST